MSGEQDHASDISLSEFNNDVKTSNGASGPWTHSTGSYSRKLNYQTSLATTRASDKSHYFFVCVCAGSFVIGVALGIVIGKFALTEPASFTSADVTSSLSQNMSGSNVTTQSPYVQTTSVTCDCNSPSQATTTRTTTTSSSRSSSTSSIETCPKCTTRNPVVSSEDEASLSPFAPLTETEIKKTLQALRSKWYITYSNSLFANRASHIYLYSTNKSHVLRYLDNKEPFPGRYAHVNVIRGSATPPDIMEYKVGPLNVTAADMDIVQLRQDGEIPFNRRPFDSTEFLALRTVVHSHLQDLQDLLQDSFDGAVFPTGISPSFAALPSKNESDRLSTMYLYLNMGDISTVRIMPVTCTIHHPDVDATKWYASDFYYASQGPFSTGKDLQEAYDSGSVRKIKLPDSYRTKHKREFDSVQNFTLPAREFSDLPPPRTYEPKGPRYTVKGHRIMWMDWEFELSSNVIHGPAIYDVRFKNSRIAYEISLQDVTLLYSSQTNGAGPPAISDTYFSLGNYNTPQLGLDCPERSTLIETTKYFYQLSKKKTACVFEADGQRPAWRHGSRGMADHHLIVRATMNLGNYDYTMEWKFFLDGSLETLLSASGYLYGAFWDPDDMYLKSVKTTTPFGYRISDYQLGPIHDHSYLFKVDIDVLGTNNSFETVHWRSAKTVEAFQSRVNISEKPSYVYFNNTRYIEHEILTIESSFNLDPYKPKYWTVINENERNYWGNNRGYRLIPYSQSAEILQEHLMFHAWDHLNFMLAVTKHRDDEKDGSMSWYDILMPERSFKGVGRMLNSEPVRHEDLVLWVNEKFYHAPTSEDLPMTLSVPRGFLLKPYNYFDRTPVFDVPAFYTNYDPPYVTENCYEG